MTQKSYDVTTYVICHNGSDVIHPNKVGPGTTLTTGQPQLEEFTEESAWKARLTELGYNLNSLHPPVTDLRYHEKEEFDSILAKLGSPKFDLNRDKLLASKS